MSGEKFTGNRKRRKSRMVPIGEVAKKIASRMKRLKARRKKLH